MISLQKTDERASLEYKIEFLHKEMIRVGIQEGLTSKRTVTISQKLDCYITKYQRITSVL